MVTIGIFGVLKTLKKNLRLTQFHRLKRADALDDINPLEPACLF